MNRPPGSPLSRRSSRVRRGGRRVACLALLAGLAACAEIGLLNEVVFAPAVPGLPGGGTWVSLPVGAWLVEGGVEPLAISACFEPECPTRAAVGLFRAKGAEADRIAASLASRDEAARSLTRARRGRSRQAGAPTIEPRRIGGFAGFALRAARPDGTGEAVELVLSERNAAGLLLLLVVSDRPENADRLARDVAARLP